MCVKDVRRCLGDVSEMLSGRCLEFIQKVSGRSLEDKKYFGNLSYKKKVSEFFFYKVSERCGRCVRVSRTFLEGF